MLNKVMLIGNLGQDVEVRHTQSGTAVASISLATSESFTKNGEKVTETEWHKVVLWDKLAEIAGKYLVKGSKVYIEGKLKTRQWDKDGVTMYTTEVVGNRMQMLDGKKESGGMSQRDDADRGYQHQQAAGHEQPYNPNMSAPVDDDIPF